MDSYKILVVDDSRAILDVLQIVFSEGYVVEKKSSASDALKWLQEGNFPDLIITDLNMPQMSGLEFIRHTKSSGLFNDIPILVLTSDEAEETKKTCMVLGVEDFIEKPFNPKGLKEKVDAILKS